MVPRLNFVLLQHRIFQINDDSIGRRTQRFSHFAITKSWHEEQRSSEICIGQRRATVRVRELTNSIVSKLG
jgi:hypothetical protein